MIRPSDTRFSQVAHEHLYLCSGIVTNNLAGQTIVGTSNQGCKWVPVGVSGFVILVDFLSQTNYLACHSSLFYQVLGQPNDPKKVRLAAFLLVTAKLVSKNESIVYATKYASFHIKITGLCNQLIYKFVKIITTHVFLIQIFNILTKEM